MEFLVSYFYQIRFFTPNMLPLSTAIWDPSWFNKDHGPGYIWMDKNKVWCGVRMEKLNPGATNNYDCMNCPFGKNTQICSFIRDYRNMIFGLDFKEITKEIEDLTLSYGCDTPVLIVHEAPSNPCSERVVLKGWFKENGKELREFRAPEILNSE